MMTGSQEEQDKFLKIFEDRSEYVTSSGETQEFREGKVSAASKARIKNIKESLEAGFLENIIRDLKHGKTSVQIEELDDEVIENITVMVESLTSEVGRALIGLTVMQLSIKSISPEQNIRLHKGSVNKNSFSWVEGISMRALDKKYVTPILREYNLLKLNADGFMMTRSLAENYPYTKLYKAQLRGARQQWLNIVESIEIGNANPTIALKFLISLLLNKASDFDDACDALLDEINKFLDRNNTTEEVIAVITENIEVSDYAARLMEVAMHSLMQAVISTGVFAAYELKPLSQMRSANKKHGNIGDIELLENSEIVESWDAKYGKNYLRDEIDEVSEKLALHDKVEIVGFVTTDTPVRNDEISTKIRDVKDLYGLDIEIMSFKDWIDWNFGRVQESELATKEELSSMWLLAYAESLAQKRRDIAPIDEPCFDWVTLLTEEIKNT